MKTLALAAAAVSILSVAPAFAAAPMDQAQEVGRSPSTDQECTRTMAWSVKS